MALSINNDIPPVFNGILQKLEEKKQVTVEEFEDLLKGLRIRNDDITAIERWLIDKGIVQRVIGGEEKKGRQDYIMLCIVKQLNR